MENELVARKIRILPFRRELRKVILEWNRCWRGVIVKEDKALCCYVNVNFKKALFRHRDASVPTTSLQGMHLRLQLCRNRRQYQTRYVIASVKAHEYFYT